MKKNVLLVYSKGFQEVLNRQSALGSYIFTFAKLLQSAGYHVHLNEYALKDLLKFSQSDSVPTRASNFFRMWMPKIVKHFWKDLQYFFYYSSIFQNISKKQFYPDFIIEFYTYGSDLGIKLKKQYNCPLLTIFDSPVLEEFEYFNGTKLFFRKAVVNRQNRTLKNSTHIVVYTNAVKNYLIEIGIQQEKIKLHQNIDFSRFEFIPPKEKIEVFTIVFIGSFLKWHKVEKLVDAYKRLINENLPVKLKLIGSGMEFDKIQSYVKGLGLQDKVEMPGFCDGEKLIKYKAQAHIGVMPGSNWYGAPNKVFEYAAAGLAVLAPSTPSIASLFPTYSGIVLFEENQKDSLYSTLKELVINKQDTYQRALLFQNYIKNNFSADKTLEFYSSIIQ